MKRLLVPVLLAACAAQQPKAPTATTTAAPPPVSAEQLVDRSGDSTDTAISVPADEPNGGVDFQNNWIYDRYGRFRRLGGGTGALNGRRYNVIDIELPNGEKKKVYFDITELWAKWNPPQK